MATLLYSFQIKFGFKYKSLSRARNNSYSFDKSLRDHMAQQESGLCYKCQPVDHLASDCPSAQHLGDKGATTAATTSPQSQVPCRHCNNFNHCTQKPCSYAHKCNRPSCGGSHPGSFCPGTPYFMISEIALLESSIQT